MRCGKIDARVCKFKTKNTYVSYTHNYIYNYKYMYKYIYIYIYVCIFDTSFFDTSYVVHVANSKHIPNTNKTTCIYKYTYVYIHLYIFRKFEENLHM